MLEGECVRYNALVTNTSKHRNQKICLFSPVYVCVCMCVYMRSYVYVCMSVRVGLRVVCTRVCVRWGEDGTRATAIPPTAVEFTTNDAKRTVISPALRIAAARPLSFDTSSVCTRATTLYSPAARRRRAREFMAKMDTRRVLSLATTLLLMMTLRSPLATALTTAAEGLPLSAIATLERMKSSRMAAEPCRPTGGRHEEEGRGRQSC